MKTIIVLSGLLLASVPFFRLLLFLIDRFSENSLPSDTYRIMAWAERLLVIVGAGAFLFLAVPGIVIAIGIGRAFSPSPGANLGFILLFPIALYALAAVIMNFPGFPLALHARLFPYVQLLLLPLLGFIPQFGIALLLPALVFCGIWLLCLWDRQTYTC